MNPVRLPVSQKIHQLRDAGGVLLHRDRANEIPVSQSLLDLPVELGHRERALLDGHHHVRAQLAQAAHPVAVLADPLQGLRLVADHIGAHDVELVAQREGQPLVEVESLVPLGLADRGGDVDPNGKVRPL